MRQVPTTIVLGVVLACWFPCVALSSQGTVVQRSTIDRSLLPHLVMSISQEYNVDPFLIDALVRVESDYNPFAVSRKGALGLMQLMPETVRRLRVQNPFDPEQNIRAGIGEFVRLLDYYAGDLHLALSAYNAGQGAVQRYGGIPPFRETRNYIVQVLSLYTGKPYRLGQTFHPPAPQVQLLEDKHTGATVITNDPAAVKALKNGAQIPAHVAQPRGILGGGFRSEKY